MIDRDPIAGQDIDRNRGNEQGEKQRLPVSIKDKARRDQHPDLPCAQERRVIKRQGDRYQDNKREAVKKHERISAEKIEGYKTREIIGKNFGPSRTGISRRQPPTPRLRRARGDRRALEHSKPEICGSLRNLRIDRHRKSDSPIRNPPSSVLSPQSSAN